MNVNHVRLALLAVFVASLGFQLIGFFIVKDKMWPEEFQSLVTKLLAIYAVQLGVILGGIFAQPRVPRTTTPAVVVGWIALVLALLWNCLLIFRSTSFVLANEDSTEELIKYLDGISAAGSFLVSGAITFFFGKAATSEPTRSKADGATARNAR
jgi:hypothetical protein